MKARKFLSLTTALVLLLAILLTGCSTRKDPADAAKTSSDTNNKGYTATTLRVAIQPSAAFVPIYLLKENGWLDQEAQKLGVKVQWTEFVSGPPMNESFAASQQDIGFIGDVPTVSAIFAGQKNTVIGVAAWGEGGYAILVPKDSATAKAEDLKGKKIGLTVGSTAQNLVERCYHCKPDCRRPCDSAYQ